MNKTITMNLSGIIFHIEEDAYERLNRYLSTIRGYFKDSEGRDEIMSDIESRIAEMLQEKVSKTKQAVLMMDVESVIALMGKPEDFAGSEEGGKREEQKQDDAYTSAAGGRRRFFRDPDDKVLGGVCSGIANYFDFDPVWMRIAFVIIALCSFGFGLILYIIMCIIIPKAKTAAEKLEMRGKKVDINNIGKVVNEEFEDFKKRMEEYGSKVNSRENRERMRTSTERAGDFIVDVLGNIFRAIVSIFSTLIIIICAVLMVLLLGSAFGMNVIHIHEHGQDHSYNIYDVYDKFFPTDMSIWFLVIGSMLFLGIPLLGLIYAGIKWLFNIKGGNKVVKYTANSLWLLGFGILIYVGMMVYQDFSEEATVKQKIELQQKDTLYLSVKDIGRWVEKDDDSRTSIRVGNMRWSEYENGADEFSQDFPVSFDIEQSETNEFQLILKKTANGESKTEAQSLAREIKYAVTQTDSLIEFDEQFTISKDNKWRGQNAKLVLKVPIGKVIYLGKSMQHIIFDIRNVHDAIDHDMVNRRWIMTREGLACLDCNNLQTVDGDTVTPALPPLPAPPAPPAPASKKYFLPEAVTFE